MASKDNLTVSSLIVAGAGAGKFAMGAGIGGITTVDVHEYVAVRKLV
jgi:hypothetical protein